MEITLLKSHDRSSEHASPTLFISNIPETIADHWDYFCGNQKQLSRKSICGHSGFQDLISVFLS